MTDAGGLLRVEAAQDRILAATPGAADGSAGAERAGAAPEPDLIGVEEALGRVLAAPVIAAVTLPPWDNSAMDGYAIRAADIAEATETAPIRLAVMGEVPAGGMATQSVEAAKALRIATGAPLPAGADAVVPVELTTPLDAAGASGPRGRDATGPVPAAVLVHAPVAAAANIRRAGSDLHAGDVLLEPGAALTPAGVALAAGAGLSAVRVHPRPRIAVLATGDEIRPAGTDLGDAAIPDANGPGLRALVRAAGAEPIDLGIASDLLEDVLARLRRALDEGADAVIVSGGVSVGPYDVVKLAFDAIGHVDLWRVAVQPGKPFAFGLAGRPGPEARPMLLFGLPGNPVSGFVTFELFVRPAIRRLAGFALLRRPLDRGVLLDEARTSEGRRAYLRATVERDADGAISRDEKGRARVRLSRGPAGQGSHVLSALASADALAIVPEEVTVHRAGDSVDLLWLDGPS